MSVPEAEAAPSRPVAAALWMTGAVASFSLMAVGGKLALAELNTFELMFARSVIGMTLVVGYGVAMGRLADARTARLGLHAVRNLFHFAAQNLWFFALAFIPMAQLFAIEFTTPIWIALLAPLLLGERFTQWRLIAAILGFIGILIVARPGVEPLNLGHLTAALSTLGFCGSIMMTKALSRTESTWTILFWLTVMQVVYGAAVLLWLGDVTWPSTAVWPWVILVGLAGLSAHLSLTQALRCAPASVVAPMDFVRLPVIAVVGWLAFAEALDPMVLAGAAVILAANVLNLRAENRLNPPSQAKVFE